MSFMSQILGSQPYETMSAGYGGAMQPIQQATGKAVGYLSPYEKVGRGALNEYYSHLNQMSNPTDFYNQIMQHYQQSPGVQFQQQQGVNALENQAAATGMTGSGQEMKDIMKYSQGLASQGQQSYLQNILGIQGGYMGGMSGLGGMGFQAAGGMGRAQMGGAEDIAQLQAAKARADAQAQAQSAGGIGNIIGDIASYL